MCLREGRSRRAHAAGPTKADTLPLSLLPVACLPHLTSLGLTKAGMGAFPSADIYVTVLPFRCVRARGSAIKRMRAELHLQEALVVQREEDAKCHEEALRLRRVKVCKEPSVPCERL